MTCPFGFLVVLPDQMLLIPVDSHFSGLTMFYMLPKELVEKRPEYLNIPRNIRDIADNEENMKLIQNDSFTEFVWSCYAYTNWHFFLLPTRDGLYRPFSGNPMQYSGNFPLWRLSYLTQPYMRMKLETDWDCSFQKFFLMEPDEELDWVSLDDFNFMFRTMFDQVVKEQKWQPIIDDSWNHRQPEDFKGTGSQGRDFMRKWTHSRTAQNVSLEQIKESGTVVGNDALYDIPDPSAEFETKVLDKMKMEDFKKRLSGVDLKILELRAQGYTQQEIAKEVGYKVPSAVSKRIEKIAEQFETFVGKEYGEFLDKHVQ